MDAPSSGFFRVPGLFVRLSSKGLNAVDPDSVWSPTSPLDFKNLPSASSIGSTSLRSPRVVSHPRVGLGLVDALTADDESSLKLNLGCTCKDSFLESIRPYLELGLPKADSDSDADAGAARRKNGSPPADASVALMSESGISDLAAQSEEYTCVIAHGPNPRTTHILGDETLEVVLLREREHESGSRSMKAVVFTVEPIGELPPPLPSSSSPGAAAAAAYGSRCCGCRKRLEEYRDIYMYLGEKAFCSNECRKCSIEEEIEEVVELMMLDSGVASASALHLGGDCC